jgi:iron complex transport system ATP-binding protein
MVVTARTVSARYGTRQVLHSVSFQLEPGTMTAVIGPNGSGKTTLMRCLSRTLRPVEGTVTVGGADIYQLSSREAAKRVAVVPQFEDHVFDFTVRDVVRMARYAWDDVDEGAVEEAVRVAALSELAERPMSALSGGERQRVLLARALAQQTPVLLLDEPTAHMDVGFQIASLSLVRSLTRDGKTALAAVHDLNLVAGFFDRAILVHDGRVAFDGLVEDVLMSDEIEHVYGAAFHRVRDPRTGRLVLAAEFVPERAKADDPLRIHLIGGGGSAAALLTELWQLGHHVTLGITSEADSDCEAARRLGVPVALAPPFTPYGQSHREAAMSLASDADCVVVCPAPYGSGNLENLTLAESLELAGKPIWVVERPQGEWDFTGGVASKHIEQLLERGARTTDGVELASRLQDSKSQ